MSEFWYRLKDHVQDGKVIPALNKGVGPGETFSVPVELTDTDFEPVPAPEPATSKGGKRVNAQG